MKKKLFAVLMMLSLAVSFMPNMAFADTDALTDSQASAVSAETQSTNQASLLLQAKAVGKHTVQLNWNKASGATKYVVYGAKCGKENKKLATVKGNKYTVKKISKKKLKAHKTYKFYVRAYSGNTKLAQSKTLHFITAKTMKKYANVTKVTAKKSISLEVGETANINAKYSVYKNKKHLPATHRAAIKYMSSNTAVATVNASGKVTAKAEGTAYIYAQDISGKYSVTSATVTAIVEPTPDIPEYIGKTKKEKAIDAAENEFNAILGKGSKEETDLSKSPAFDKILSSAQKEFKEAKSADEVEKIKAKYVIRINGRKSIIDDKKAKANDIFRIFTSFTNKSIVMTDLIVKGQKDIASAESYQEINHIVTDTYYKVMEEYQKEVPAAFQDQKTVMLKSMNAITFPYPLDIINEISKTFGGKIKAVSNPSDALTCYKQALQEVERALNDFDKSKETTRGKIEKLERRGVLPTFQM